jgi:hypothetical protein
VKIFEAQNHLCDVKPGMINLKFPELLENSHEVSTFDELKVHENYSLVLGNSIHFQYHWVIKVIHYADLVVKMTLLFILDQLVLALHLDSHLSRVFVSKLLLIIIVTPFAGR